MFDALNVSIWSDDRGGASGNEGVVKPIKSNVLLDGSGAFDNASDKVVLGKVIDSKYDVVYFFVYCSNVSDSGVYAYDPTNYLSENHPAESVFKVYATSEFNFHPESFVKGDITYVQKKREFGGRVYEDTPMLFFTDNRNEPRKLNVLRAVWDPTVTTYIIGSAGIKDFITACPKTPTFPITFEFIQDESSPYSEFKNVNGFQFAYQLVYKDSNVSAMSTISDIAVPPSYVNQGVLPVPYLSLHNVCRVTVPPQAISSEVEKVKILARRGNDGAFFEIKEIQNTVQYVNGIVEAAIVSGADAEDLLDILQDIDTSDPALTQENPFIHDFKNDTINIAISQDDQVKHFDNLPKRAEAQSIADNRLFYGNYVEGFDQIETQATITALPQPRTPDFTNYDVKITPATCISGSLMESIISGEAKTISDSDGGDIISGRWNKNTAFVISPYEMPNEGIAVGDEVSLTFSFIPDTNWHIYDSTNSYHQSNQLGDFFGHPIGTVFPDGYDSTPSGLEGRTEDAFFQDDMGVLYSLLVEGENYSGSQAQGPNHFFPAICNNDGVQDEGGLKTWKSYNSVEGSLQCKYGTSAANPLIVQGGEINISIKIKALQTNGKEAISEFISHLITGEPLDTTVVSASTFQVIENNINATYTYDLGLQNQDFFNQSDPLGKLIVMVGGDDQELATVGNPQNIAGCFIINKATVELGFFKDEAYHLPLIDDNNGFQWQGEGSGWDEEIGKRRIGMYVKRITNVETMTCKRRLLSCSPWVVFDNADAMLSSTSTSLPYGPFESNALNVAGNTAGYYYLNGEFTNDDEGGLTSGCFRFWNGYLDYASGTGQTNVFFQDGVNEPPRFSLMDGEGGIGGGPTASPNPTHAAEYDEYVVVTAPFGDDFTLTSAEKKLVPSLRGLGNLGSAPLLTAYNNQGVLTPNAVGISGYEENVIRHGPIVSNNMYIYQDWRYIPDGSYNVSSNFNTGFCLPQVKIMGGFNTILGYQDWDKVDNISVYGYPEGATQGPSSAGTFIIRGSMIEAHGAPKLFNFSFYNTSLYDGDGSRSYKSGANHAFGIVYYDARGRASNVYTLGSVLSPEYHARPQGLEGKVEMQVQMDHNPPADAETFQIVYSGNTSINTFIQYSTSGAYISTRLIQSDDAPFYVGLNYLQDSGVSYKDNFGARRPDGGSPYSYRDGDILRVISYYATGDLDSRIWLSDEYEFEVTGSQDMPDDAMSPIYVASIDGPDTHPAKRGFFVKVKNNPNALGFSFGDIKDGTNQPDSQSHNWGKRCVVEIYNPADVVSEENLVFYETGDVFPISDHNQPLTLSGGDVWWRKVAVNMAEHDGGSFVNLIQEDTLEPNFKNYSLETEAFNDTVRNSDVTGKGKLKIIIPNAQEVVRSSSITYSEKNNPASALFTLTSFNPAKMQFKDMPAEYGNINYMVNQQDSMFVIQSSRCSSVPVNRNLITTASNDQSLIAATKVLGTERYYAGEYGCDDNPESVCVVGPNVYFASKSSKEVYKFNPSTGLDVISNKGMKSFFRDLFKSAENDEGVIKVVGGYDPIKDEFILSVYNQPSVQYVEGAEGTSGAASGGVVFQDTTTINSLEQQLYNVIKTITTLTTTEGEEIFSQGLLPAPLQQFYQNFSGTNELDYLNGLDADNSGIMEASEVVGYGSIFVPLQQQIYDTIAVIESNAIVDIINTITEVIDDPSIDTAQEIQNYISGLQIDNFTLTESLSALQTSYDTLQSDYDGLQANYVSLQADIVSNEADIEQLNQQIVDQLAQISNLQTQANEDGNTITDLNAQLAQFAAQAGLDADTIAQLQNQVSIDAETIAQLEAAAQVSEGTIANLNNQLANSNAQIAAMQASLEAQAAEITALTLANQEANALVVGYEQNISSLEGQVSVLQGAIASLNLQVENYLALIQQLNADVGATSGENTELVAENLALQVQLDLEAAALRSALVQLDMQLLHAGYGTVNVANSNIQANVNNLEFDGVAQRINTAVNAVNTALSHLGELQLAFSDSGDSTTTINPKGGKWWYFSEEGSSEVNVLLGERVKPFAWGNANLDNGAQIKAFANAVNDVKTLGDFWMAINPNTFAAGAGVGTEYFQYDASGNLINQEEIAARGYLGSSIVDMLQSYVNTNGSGEITASTLEEVLATDGISMSQFVDLLAGLSNIAGNIDFLAARFDTQGTGEIGQNDFLTFLSLYGAAFYDPNNQEKYTVNI
jgi:hypothetical protein